jgi:hypothetical protein
MNEYLDINQDTYLVCASRFTTKEASFPTARYLPESARASVWTRQLRFILSVAVLIISRPRVCVYVSSTSNTNDGVCIHHCILTKPASASPTDVFSSTCQIFYQEESSISGGAFA